MVGALQCDSIALLTCIVQPKPQSREDENASSQTGQVRDLPEGMRHGGTANPVRGFATQWEAEAAAGIFVGPVPRVPVPVGVIRDIDFYQCPRRGFQQIRGDEVGPRSTLGLHINSDVIVIDRTGRPGAYRRRALEILGNAIDRLF